MDIIFEHLLQLLKKMASGKEIKRLRGKVPAAKVAELIGVNVDRLRKWEDRDTDPSDTADRQKVEEYFGVSLSQLSALKQFDFVQYNRTIKNPDRNDQDYKDKYIALLERRLADMERVFGQLTAIEQMITEARVDMGIMAAMQKGYQEYWAENYPPKNKKAEDVLTAIHNKAFSSLEKIQQGGISI